MILQEVCDTLAFEIYEYNKIKGNKRTLAIDKFWELQGRDADSIPNNTIVYTPFNKLTFTGERLLESEKEKGNYFRVVDIEELEL